MKSQFFLHIHMNCLHLNLFDLSLSPSQQTVVPFSEKITIVYIIIRDIPSVLVVDRHSFIRQLVVWRLTNWEKAPPTCEEYYDTMTNTMDKK